TRSLSPPTATHYIHPLSLHDALPISGNGYVGATNASASPATVCADVCCVFSFQVLISGSMSFAHRAFRLNGSGLSAVSEFSSTRSEEHTSELQSRENLVCRLLLEKKK